MTPDTRSMTSRALVRSAVASGAVAVLLVAGCSSNDILDVNTPDVVTPDDVANASGAEALRTGAFGRLREALAGTYIGATGLILVSGTLADEFVLTSNRAGLEATDSRQANADNVGGYITSQFERLSQTRLIASQALDALRTYAPDRQASVGQVLTVRTFAEILLAEQFCSGVPLSSVIDGQPVYGDPLTGAEVFTGAVAQLDSAVVLASDDQRILNLARVTLGRALLNLARFDEAAAAVNAVPTDFVYNAEFSSGSTSLYNGVNVWLNSARIYSISDQEGENGIDYRSAADPRLEVYDAGLAQDGENTAWVPAKYDGFASPIVLADGIEARLIEAEARLRADDAGGALTILNDLRARVPGLAPLPDAGSADGRVDQLFRERAFWMFGTAHRLGDMRRLVRQYGRSQASVFPIGPYFRGGDYGSEVTFPIPLEESNNPLSTGCINRDA